MTPTILAGDLVVLRAFHPGQDAPQVGEIVAYEFAPGQPNVLHRVVSVSSDGQYVITKGDANPSADPKPVSVGQIKGTYEMRVLQYGRVVAFAKSRWGVLALVVLPSLVVLVREIRKIAKMTTQAPPAAPAPAPAAAPAPATPPAPPSASAKPAARTTFEVIKR
jgi:signal peptidase I